VGKPEKKTCLSICVSVTYIALPTNDCVIFIFVHVQRDMQIFYRKFLKSCYSLIYVTCTLKILNTFWVRFEMRRVCSLAECGTVLRE